MSVFFGVRRLVAAFFVIRRIEAGFLGRWPRLFESLARWAGIANHRPVVSQVPESGARVRCQAPGSPSLPTLRTNQINLSVCQQAQELTCLDLGNVTYLSRWCQLHLKVLIGPFFEYNLMQPIDVKDEHGPVIGAVSKEHRSMLGAGCRLMIKLRNRIRELSCGRITHVVPVASSEYDPWFVHCAPAGRTTKATGRRPATLEYRKLAYRRSG